MAAARRKDKPSEVDEAGRDLERWRGAMDERIDNLVKALDRQHDDFKDAEVAAALHRQGLRDVIAALSQSVATLSNNMMEMRPMVSVLEANRHRAQGFVWALRMLWAAIGGMAGAALVKFGVK